MSTKSPKLRAPQDPDTDDQTRLRAYMASSEWQARLQQAALKRARAAGEPSGEAPGTERPARVPGPPDDAVSGPLERSDAPSSGRQDLGHRHSCTDTDEETRSPKPVDSVRRMERARAARAQALAGRKSEDSAAGTALPETGPLNIGTLVPLPVPIAPAAVHADANASGSCGLPPARGLRSLGGWFTGIAAGFAACLLAGGVLYGALRLWTDPRPVAIGTPDVTQHLTDIEWTALRPASGPPQSPAGSTVLPAISPQPSAVIVESPHTRLASGVLPVPSWLMPPPSRAADPAPVVDVGVARPQIGQFIAGPAGAAAPVPATPSPSLARLHRAADPAAPPDRVVAPHPPRVGKVETTNWTEFASTLHGRLRAVLTQSGNEGAGVARLGRLGVAVEDVQITRFAVPVTRVHYFHGADAGPARRLATDLGGEAVDLTGFAPSPPPGTFEIHLAE